MSKIFEPAYVIDNKDPLMLNRVRVNFAVQVDGKNNQSILDSVPDIYKENGDLKPEEKWGKHDPFVFLPLIPAFLKFTPKEKEYVNVIWPNPNSKFNEQYYVPGSLSSALTFYKEDGETSRKFSTMDKIVRTKKLKNPETNFYWKTPTKGVFIEPEDIGIQGRGSCDIIVKENEILLRAGKSKTYPTNAEKDIEIKTNRSFLQLTDIDVNILDKGIDTVVRLLNINAYVKTLVEWRILNPENQFNKFNLVIYLYKLSVNPRYTTEKFKIDTNVLNTDKSLIYQIQFVGANNTVTKEQIVDYVNRFIQGVNAGEINIDPFDKITLSDQLPCYFRPHPDTYKWLKVVGPSLEEVTVSEVSEKIGFKAAKNGAGLIFFKNKTGPQQEVKLDKVRKFERTLGSNTMGIMGSDRLVFLSHLSQIPGTQLINLTGDTIYGLSKDFIYEKVIPSTNSFVRGEQLMNFLNLVVRFLIGHVHPFPGLPPVPTSIDGVTTQQILIELQNAPNTILNEYIRIN